MIVKFKSLYVHLFIAFALPLTALAGTIDFISGGSFTAGTEPRSVASGDFNNDGKPDLAIANSTTFNQVSILLGNGDGTFQTQTFYNSGTESPNAISVAIADFNDDAKLDLAVANSYDNNVATLLGNGDGTFQFALTYSVGAHPVFVTTGDFNGDAKPDLVTANSDSNNASVLLGVAGNGTLQARTTYSTGTDSSPQSIAIGDFDNDTAADLAIANYGSQTALILTNQNNGSGAFNVGSSISISTGRPNSIAVGNFNGDNNLDLAVNAGGRLYLLIGQGTGGFNTPTLIVAEGSNPSVVNTGDFDRDGKFDLVALAPAASIEPNSVRILRGNGDATFASPVYYPVGSYPRSVAVADFNGDGNPDLAVTNKNSNNVSILINGIIFKNGFDG